MRAIMIAAVAALALASAANAAPGCKTGVQCGNTCIPRGQICHVAPPPAPRCHLIVSKPCGNTCIPKSATCHK
jgi:hypothetical protein